jgi:hypothetical protein
VKVGHLFATQMILPKEYIQLLIAEESLGKVPKNISALDPITKCQVPFKTEIRSNFTELCATLLRVQLQRLPQQHRIRFSNANYLMEKLNCIEGICCQVII